MDGESYRRFIHSSALSYWYSTLHNLDPQTKVASSSKLRAVKIYWNKHKIFRMKLDSLTISHKGSRFLLRPMMFLVIDF